MFKLVFCVSLHRLSNEIISFLAHIFASALIVISGVCVCLCSDVRKQEKLKEANWWRRHQLKNLAIIGKLYLQRGARKGGSNYCK